MNPEPTPHLNNVLINTSFLEQKQKLYPADKNGNILNEKQLKELKSRTNTMALCDGYILDGGSYYATLKYTVFNTDLGNTSTAVNVEYEIVVPGNIAAAGNVGTLLLPGSTGNPTLKYTTSLVNLTLLETYYDIQYESDMNKYRVSFTISVPYNTFCSYSNYRLNVKISTDCYAIDSFTTKTTGNLGVVTNTYREQYVNAYSPSPGQIYFQQLNVMSPPTYCYDAFPLINSTKYLVQYKLITSSVWIDLPSTLLQYGDSTISGLSAGTYEYRYTYLLRSTPDIYYPAYRYGTSSIVVY